MLRAIFAGLFSLSSLAAAQQGTAIAALKMIPKDAAKRLARIEAREGAPWPERWYFIVHDPAQPLGLREYVVADGTLKANRTLSQFADSVNAGDIVGTHTLKFDSDAVAAVAGRFAVANGARLGSVNYEFGKYGNGGSPAWRATVLNEKSEPRGVLILDARTGAVERHDGFDILPAELAERPVSPFVPAARTSSAVAATPPVVKPAAKIDSLETLEAEKPILEQKPTPKPVAKPVQTARISTPTPKPTPRPNAIKRFGSSVKKLFGE